MQTKADLIKENLRLKYELSEAISLVNYFWDQILEAKSIIKETKELNYDLSFTNRLPLQNEALKKSKLH